MLLHLPRDTIADVLTIAVSIDEAKIGSRKVHSFVMQMARRAEQGNTFIPGMVDMCRRGNNAAL